MIDFMIYIMITQMKQLVRALPGRLGRKGVLSNPHSCLTNDRCFENKDISCFGIIIFIAQGTKSAK